MAGTFKSIRELEDIFRIAALRILGLPEDDNDTVRFPYDSSPGVSSAPFIKRTDNVCFLFVSPEAGDYANPVGISYRNDGAERMTRIERRTDIYRVNFQCYGPDSFVMVSNIISGLSMQPIAEFLLYQNQLAYVQGGSRTPVEMREPKDGEWWTRYDYAARFYHATRIETPNHTRWIETVHIQTKYGKEHTDGDNNSASHG